MNFPFLRRALPLHARARMVYCIHKTRKGGHPMKKRFQTPLCALSALVLAAACTTAAYAAEIPVPADAISVPQAAPADVADAPRRRSVLPDGGTPCRAHPDAGGRRTRGLDGGAVRRRFGAGVHGGKKPDSARSAPAVTAAQQKGNRTAVRFPFCCALRGILFIPPFSAGAPRGTRKRPRKRGRRSPR